MKNRIDELLTKLKEEQGVTVTEFAARCNLPPTTIYNARKREDMGKITVDVFLKIAHGLGMTAEQLYYGEDAGVDGCAAHPLSTDEQAIVDGYRAASDEVRAMMANSATFAIQQADSRAAEKKEAV